MTKESKITVIRKRVGQPASLVELSRSLEELQNAVGGYIELVPLFENLTMLCHEDAKFLGKPVNMALPWKDDVVAGDVVFVRIDPHDNWSSVDRTDLNRLCDYFGLEQMGFPI